MISFVTLFDVNYMSRGIVLYNSLKENCKDKFTLYVLAMDNKAANYLKDSAYPNMVLITVDEIKEMYPVLIQLEKKRTRGEFSWTLSSFSIQYVLRKYNVESCTYIDSDICFYNDPQLLLNELGDKSVLITEHNYTPEYDQSASSGKFCVQFMYFKNNEDGNKVLEYWRSKCEEWCYNRFEEGKFGDQRYLDDWESRFAGIVYNCRNIGCGLAPWNIQKYVISEENGILYVTEKITKIKKPVVFYHYHELKEIKEKKWCCSQYYLTDNDKLLLYKPYINKLYNEENKYPNELVIKRYNKIHSSIVYKIRGFLGYIKQYNSRKNGYVNQSRNIEYFY